MYYIIFQRTRQNRIHSYFQKNFLSLLVYRFFYFIFRQLLINPWCEMWSGCKMLRTLLQNTCAVFYSPDSRSACTSTVFIPQLKNKQNPNKQNTTQNKKNPTTPNQVYFYKIVILWWKYSSIKCNKEYNVTLWSTGRRW